MTRGSSTRCGNGQLLIDELGQNVRLVGPANCRRAQPSFVSHEVGYPRTPCCIRPLCREDGRCCRDWAGGASLHPHRHAVRQVSRQAKTCCSDERFLLENVPVRARGRRAHELCTREVGLDDGGQTLMINYYSALLYCGKILILQQKSLVRATRSAALTKQKVNTWYR